MEFYNHQPITGDDELDSKIHLSGRIASILALVRLRIGHQVFENSTIINQVVEQRKVLDAEIDRQLYGPTPRNQP